MHRMKVMVGLIVGLSICEGRLQAAPASEELAALVVVTNRDSGDLTLIDTRRDEVVGRIPIGQGASAHMTMVTPDGQRAVTTATGLNEVVVSDLATRTVLARVPIGRAPEHFDLSADGRFAYIGNMNGDSVSIVDLNQAKEVARLEGFFEPHGITAASNGKVYVSNFGAHELGVIDASGRKVLARLAVAESPRLAALNPLLQLAEIKGIANPTPTVDGRFLYLADGDAGTVTIIETQNDRVVTTIPVGAEPWRAYASPDGRWMLVPNNGDETVTVLDAMHHRLQTELKTGPGMTGVNFTKDGRKAYVIASGERAVYVFDLSKMALLKRLPFELTATLETAVTTPDGRKLYLASSTNNTVYVIHTDDETVTPIRKVGLSPWGTHMLGTHDHYCH